LFTPDQKTLAIIPEKTDVRVAVDRKLIASGHGKSSSELGSVMIRNPMVGNVSEGKLGQTE
jgi:hypothetical protein